MTIRRNVITGDPVIFAPERAERPHAFVDDTSEEICPFCPGNESQTPPEVLRIGDGRAWRVRVFPNKYPAVDQHEVIVESPRHDATFDQIEDATSVVSVYLDRYRAMAATNPPHISLFKNDGQWAGASLAHIHSQIAAVPFVPPRIQTESAAFASASTCPLCAAIESHRRDGLVIAEDDWFIWIAPFAPSFAYQQWIVPKRHQNEFASLDDREVESLGAALKRSVAAMRRIANSYNWLVLSFANNASAHAYVDVFPRVTGVAGFELSTGTYIDVVDPAKTVRKLR